MEKQQPYNYRLRYIPQFSKPFRLLCIEISLILSVLLLMSNFGCIIIYVHACHVSFFLLLFFFFCEYVLLNMSCLLHVFLSKFVEKVSQMLLNSQNSLNLRPAKCKCYMVYMYLPPIMVLMRQACPGQSTRVTLTSS